MIETNVAINSALIPSPHIVIPSSHIVGSLNHSRPTAYSIQLQNTFAAMDSMQINSGMKPAMDTPNMLARSRLHGCDVASRNRACAFSQCSVEQLTSDNWVVID